MSAHRVLPPRKQPGGWSSHGQPVDQLHSVLRKTDAGPRCFQLRHGRRSSAAKAFPWTWTTSFRASKERGVWLVKNHRHFASSLAIHGKKSISVSLGGLRLCAPGCYGCSRSPLSISQYFLTWILLLLNETICVQHALHSVNSLCWWIW